MEASTAEEAVSKGKGLVLAALDKLNGISSMKDVGTGSASSVSFPRAEIGSVRVQEK